MILHCIQGDLQKDRVVECFGKRSDEMGNQILRMESMTGLGNT